MNVRSASLQRSALAASIDRQTPVSDASAGKVIPPLDPKLALVRAAVVMVLTMCAAMLAQITIVSAVQHNASQQRVFDRFRDQLAQGTIAVGPTDADGNVVAMGDPIALLEIPTIDLSEVVVQGTSAGELFVGPGHRRDTPFPGQYGVSLLFGRRSAYGAPFRRIGQLVEGDLVRVTTGQGVFEYRALGVRRAGDPIPALTPGSSRLVLATADGTPLLPSGVLRVDADIDGQPSVGATPLVSDRGIASSERLLGTDHNTLWVLVLWLQAMIVLTLAAVWAWHRWSRPRTWVVFAPLLLVVGLAAAGETVRLLPNLT